MIITIDGPAASGKSTIAQRLAQELDFVHINSGLLYRAITLALVQKIGMQEIEEKFMQTVKKYAESPNDLNVHPQIKDKKQKIYINEEYISLKALESEIITEKTGTIADTKEYRTWVNKKLKVFSSAENLVVDGRDIGTLVFPESKNKFYLDCELEIRAQRRLNQIQKDLKENLKENIKNSISENKDLPIEEKLKNMKGLLEKRDQKDRNRTWGKLLRPKDSTFIDTSHMNIENVLALILTRIQHKYTSHTLS